MQPFDSVTRLESAQALDRLADPLRRAVQTVLPPGRLRDLLHGVPVGHPVHPTLVQVSLGAFLSASVLDAVPGNEGAATTLVATGLVTAPASAVSGWADWSELHESQQRVGVVHAAANLAGVVLYGLSLASRLRGDNGRGRLLGWAGLSVLGAGGFLGGHLSFRQASGANHVEDVPHLVAPGWQDLCALDDLPDGRLEQRMLGDVPLLALRRGTRVQVLSDRCSHLSGPLHDGELVDGGSCVTCPWHSSVFRLDDGAVQRGPATAPAHVFEVRVGDGRVEVRLPDAG